MTVKKTPSKPLSGLHLLLTYECNYECDHCFVWGGRSQTGTMTIGTVEDILAQAQELGSIEWIYFEGGEAFLYFETMIAGIRSAKESGFKVGIVTNSTWATTVDAALEWLTPLAGLVDDLSISSDDYHGSHDGVNYPEIARRAAQQLDIPVDFISVAEPEALDEEDATAVVFRGRAAEVLASRVPARPWEQFDTCPWEDLREPERVHVDPFGNLHICQGISIGNMLKRPLTEIMGNYDADAHPIVGPLLAGGPAEIVRQYDLAHEEGYADHCHLCYKSRCALRERFADVLTPDQMYGPG